MALGALMGGSEKSLRASCGRRRTVSFRVFRAPMGPYGPAASVPARKRPAVLLTHGGGVWRMPLPSKGGHTGERDGGVHTRRKRQEP